MDIMTILGWIVGFGLIVWSIMTGEDAAGKMIMIPKQIMGFIDPGSIAIVCGGTIAALMVSYPFKSFAKIPKHLKIVIFPKKFDPNTYIEQIVTFAKEARMNGLLAIEDKLSQTEDKFLKNSLMLVVDSVEPEKVKMLLDMELDYLDDRHMQDISFYYKAAEFAPSFGMIGTLVGLINLLGNLSDAEALAVNMSVALVTTFYGVILANLIFKPIGNKMKIRHDEETLCKTLICEGVKSIQDGDNPTFIEEKLIKLLPEHSPASGGAEKKEKKSKK